ncbi:MAG: GNAT family N-acetyltransferase [Polymorphobacter sp.]
MSRHYPRTIDCDGVAVELRRFLPADEAAVLAFAKALPPHDLLFINRDITHPRVIKAWLAEIAEGTISTIIAVAGDKIVGCCAVVADALSWSPHVGEIRVLVASEMRDHGLGRTLAQEALVEGISRELSKLTVCMTIDQRGAIAVFESLGFRGEALLKDQVRSRDGDLHDIAVLSHDVAQVAAQQTLFGIDTVA